MPRKKKPERRQRGTGSISVDKRTGVIRARVTIDGEDRRRSKKFRPGMLAEAEAWIAAHLDPAPVVTIVSLRDWAGSWWWTYVEPIRPPNTAKWYLYALRKLARLYGLPLADIRPSALQGVVGALSGRLDAASVQGIVGVWRRCLAAAVEDGLIARNPASRLTLPKVTRRQPARYLTPDEVAQLWPAIRGRRFEGGFAIMLGCGLRIGEVLGLAWESIDFEHHRIWVQRQYTNGHWRDLPKGHNPHWVPMPEDVELALRRHRLRQPPGSVLVMQSPHRGYRKKSGDPLPWSAQVIRAELREIIDELEIDDFTPHASRHGLATHLMSKGVSAAVIAERLGNTPAVVLNTYSHATPGGRSQADELVDEYLGGDTDDELPDAASGT